MDNRKVSNKSSRPRPVRSMEAVKKRRNNKVETKDALREDKHEFATAKPTYNKTDAKVNVGQTRGSLYTTENRSLRPRRAKMRSIVPLILRRMLILVIFVFLLAVYVLFSAISTVANGPSETIRDTLVLSAMQASATKWVPGLFLSDETVSAIVENSKKVNTDTISIDDYTKPKTEKVYKDEWENAVDGMIFETVNGNTYKAYVLLVRDPARVFVGTSSDYKSGKQGMKIFDAAEKYDCVAAINAGEFRDSGGVGTGDNPIGITYSEGKLVWDDRIYNRTFIGFDANNRLIVSEGMTKSRADELKIRDGVCFQTGNVLITQDGDNITFHYADKNSGTSQRTAIGQRADGTVILLVTDGRSASSLGATHNDVIDIMVDYGAVSAGMLDGGSSAMMYYENYYDKYDFDKTQLDQFQEKGLVNKYKAFTTPRKIPTFFMVMDEK